MTSQKSEKVDVVNEVDVDYLDKMKVDELESKIKIGRRLYCH